jgi:hypothetical protein
MEELDFDADIPSSAWRELPYVNKVKFIRTLTLRVSG